MTSIRLWFCATLALACLAAVPALAQSPIWADEFDGDQLDTTKWTYDVGGHGFGNQELQFYSARPDNVRVDDGKLVITAYREAYEGKAFSSGRIKSHGRMAFKYGTIEARIKVPDLANGLWPAFWLLGDNIGQNSWPACGEIDILEMGSEGAINDGVVNRRVGAAAHWDHLGNYANHATHIDAAVGLNNDYHLYKLTWTPTLIRAYLDGVQFYALDITGGAGSSLEEFHRPMFVVANLAVGGINFVNITNPANITAPFPAQLEIDWIRLYDNGFTELYTGADTAESGPFGIYTETTPVNNELAYDVDTDLFIWNNMTATTNVTPYEGSDVMSFHMAANNWFGMGVYCRQNRNMANYANGHLHFHMKTTSTQRFAIGIASAAAGEGWVNITEEFGLVRDGAWHEVVIPLARFANVDFNTIVQIFMFNGDVPTTGIDVAIDNVYWTPSVALPAPENGNYGIFTDTAAHKTAGEFVLETDGAFYVWENTMQALPGSPYEGANSMALTTTPGLNWFGAAFTPNSLYNLSAFRYPTSVLHFALKTSSTTTFQIGMHSGSVEHIGQKWITFENGNDPYGFVRDGNWHVIEVPMSDIMGYVDLTKVDQFFEILGTDGPISDIEVDDICLLNGGEALSSGTGTPTADAGPDVTIVLPTNAVTLNGSGEDDGTIVDYAWQFLTGPAAPTLTGADTATLNVSGMVAGTYVFRLTVTDDEGLFGSDTVTVYVRTPEPTADAGPDQAIDLPVDYAALAGSGDDADGVIVEYLWTQVSGPNTAVLTDADTATATASGLIEGVYVFELTVTDDDDLTDSDQVTVTVTNPPVNLALNKPATASSVENAGTPAAFAVDGDPGTRWSSAAADPQWIEIDLGEVYSINQFSLLWETAAAQTYDIDVSDDGATWTTVFSTTEGTAGPIDIDVDTAGRYVRMYGTVRTTPWGYSIFEFEVYGSELTDLPHDADGDGDVDLDDYAMFLDCLMGPEAAPAPVLGLTAQDCLDVFDADADGDVDLADYMSFTAAFSG